MDLLGRARTFVRIVEAGSLSAAARSLGSSLPAISRQVTTLEEELRATLLVRTTRSQRLTDEGRRFHEHALRLVREADAAIASVRHDGLVRGEVTISSSVTIGTLRIIPALAKLYADHPHLRVELRLEERAVDLVGEGVDIGIRAGLALPDTTAIVAQPLATFRRFIVASPRLLRAEGSPRDSSALIGRSAVVGLRGGTTWEVRDEDQTRSVTVDPKLRVGTLVAIRDAAIAGIGYANLPEFVVSDALANGTLKRVLPRTEIAPVNVHALYRVEMRGTPRIEAVIAHLRATLPTADAEESLRQKR